MHTTLVQRDTAMYRRKGLHVVGTKFANDENREVFDQLKGQMWSMVIARNMLCETCAILLRFAAMTLLSPHQYSFMLGFPISTSASAMTLVYFNVALELATEFAVDCFALYAEFQRGLNVDCIFSFFKNRWQFFSVLSNLLSGLVVGLVMVTHVPNFLFCGKPHDICSCDVDHVYPKYASFCSSDSTLGSNTSNTTVVFTNTSLPDLSTAISNLDDDDAATVAIALFSFAAIVAITIASNAWVKSRKHRKVTSESIQRLESKLAIANSKINILHKTMTKNQQKQVEESMEKDTYAPLLAYSITRQHVDFEAQIGSGAMGEVWRGTFRKHTRVAIKKILWGTDMTSALTCFRNEGEF